MATQEYFYSHNLGFEITNRIIIQLCQQTAYEPMMQFYYLESGSVKCYFSIKKKKKKCRSTKEKNYDEKKC